MSRQFKFQFKKSNIWFNIECQTFTHKITGFDISCKIFLEDYQRIEFTEEILSESFLEEIKKQAFIEYKKLDNKS